MLHIINGDSTAETLNKSAVPGEKFSFSDALICGPTPAGLDLPEWVHTRAQHLSEDYQAPIAECKEKLLAQEQVLHTFSAHEELVLWFEHDLFCQVNLLYLLDWFAKVQLGLTRLSLINIGTFPGKKNFRGLGELNAEELASLFPKRNQVTRSELDLGAKAWQAYCSTDPRSIEALLETDTTRLPFLKTALQIHLRRFPSLYNGLGWIENRGLDLINRGSHRFTDLFSRFVSAEPAYGLGDAQFWTLFRRLASVGNPLLSLSGKLDSDSFKEVEFHLTDTGRTVLKGEADFVRLNGIDRWLGGVHLSGRDHLWRWNSQAGRLAFG